MRINNVEKTAVMADLHCNRVTPDGLQRIEELIPVQRSSRKQGAVEKKKARKAEQQKDTSRHRPQPPASPITSSKGLGGAEHNTHWQETFST